MALEERLPAVAAMGQAFRSAKGDTEGFGASLRGVGSAGLSGLRTAATGVMGVLGGPFGLALAGVTAAITLFSGSNEEAEERQRKFAGASRDVAKSLQEENNALNKKTRAAASSALEEAGLLELSEKHGINTQQLTDAYLGNNEARKSVNASIRGQIAALNELEDAALAANDPNKAADYDSQIDGLRDVQVAIDNAIGTRQTETAAIDRQARASREETAAKSGAAGETSRLQGSEQNFQAVIEKTGLEYDANKTRLENLLNALKAYNSEVTGATDSEEGWFAALDQLNAGVKENGNSLDINTEAGRSNRDALEELAGKTKQLYIDQINAGVSVEEATATYNRNMDQVYATAGALTFNKGQADALIQTYGGLPKNILTEYQTKGYETVQSQLHSLSVDQQLAAQGIAITDANRRAYNKQVRDSGYATGGEVSGPGTSTSDSIPAWLSNNEHVWTAREVSAAGGHDAVEGLRAAALRGKLPAFAAGGAVNVPFVYDLTKTKIPDPFEAAMKAAARGGGGAGVQRWSPLVLQTLSMLGQPAGLLPNVLRRMNQESGGNPNAINLWDSNAKKGTPSIGLMQVIQPTFNRWRNSGLSANIYDPAANVYAGLNYAQHRYPSLQYAMDKPGGYKNGGWLKPGQRGVNETSKPEPVLSTSQWDDVGGLLERVGALVAVLEKNAGQPTRVYNLGMEVKNTPIDVATQITRMELMSGL
jgi:SLT domain-containing protein